MLFDPNLILSCSSRTVFFFSFTRRVLFLLCSCLLVTVVYSRSLLSRYGKGIFSSSSLMTFFFVCTRKVNMLRS